MKSLKDDHNDQQADQFSTSRWLTEQAVEKHKAGELEAAIAYYLETIELNLQQPDWVYANTITLLGQVQRFESGLDLGTKALSIYPESSDIYRALGLIAEQQQHSRESIKYYQTALDLEPQQPDWLYCNLAKQLLEKTQNPSAAAAIASQGIQLYANFFPLNYVLGNALTELSEWEAAISAYQRVQQLNPNWLEVEQKLNQAIYRKTQAERLIHHQYHPAPVIPESIPQATTPVTEENPETANFQQLFVQLQNQTLNHEVCEQIWTDYSGAELHLNYGCWLSPNILYLEAQVNDYWILQETAVLACSANQYAIAPGNFFQITEQQLAGVVCFAQDLYTAEYSSYRCCFNDAQNPVFLVGEIAQKSYGLEFIDYLQTKPDYQKHLIRESLSRSIIQLVREAQKPQAAELLQKLQYFLHIPPSHYIDPNLPFKIFIDYIIPLKSEGLFISGWLQDPYQMLEKITAVSALGFSLELTEADIYRLDRRDVNQFLQNTRYGDFEGKLGFCAYAAVPETIHQSIQDFAELHSFRFIVRLQGNIEIEIIPDAKYSDAYNARQKVMQIAEPKQVSFAMLANCLAPVGLKLQQLCIAQVKIKDVITIGNLTEHPLISIIIPLYRRLDFLKVQLATMANDPAIAQCEIIYVLDSPEQEVELRTFLLNHCTLYQLPVKLVVMERNSGYAAANNAGVSQARGKYLVLLNSDVFAKSQRWMLKMAEFYQSNPQIGALGAKLLYEDGSLQHAGMFFAQTTFPFWLTLHYYKGLPGNYPLAQHNRAVPAVTGACMMISRELYHQVGGLTTDYVIGDFEDSDLCFKCHQLGYESWYFADVTLYHLERQSVPLNSSYNGSLAWRLNGHLHQKRWGTEIEEVMNKFN